MPNPSTSVWIWLARLSNYHPPIQSFLYLSPLAAAAPSAATTVGPVIRASARTASSLLPS
eukprot:3775548-Pleurochrysis_carterae.AAC.1